MGSGIWWVYMIECRGGKIYTGIAKDPEARYRRHLSGNGAAYTRINPPVALLAKRPCGTRSDALREERNLRRLTGGEKRAWAREGKDPGSGTSCADLASIGKRRGDSAGGFPRKGEPIREEND